MKTLSWDKIQQGDEEALRNLRGTSIHTRLLVCFVETHDSERTEKRE